MHENFVHFSKMENMNDKCEKLKKSILIIVNVKILGYKRHKIEKVLRNNECSGLLHHDCTKAHYSLSIDTNKTKTIIFNYSKLI